MFAVTFDDVCDISLDSCSDEDSDVEILESIEVVPAFLSAKSPIQSVSKENTLALIPSSNRASLVSSQQSSTRTLQDIDLNGIKARLDAEFSDAALIDERALDTLNGRTNNMGKKERKPYESAIRSKKEIACIPIKERRLTTADLQRVETVKCNCKTFCCLAFSQSDILELRQFTYSMSQKDRKEFLIRDLLKSGTRTTDAFKFKYFLKQKEVSS
jgi:hypothetical protein